MGKGSSAPDPYQTAAAQTQSNEQTAAYNAALNRTSQYTPYGNSIYKQTGVDSTGAPTWSNTITLTPEAQKQLDNQLAQNDQLSSIGFGLADQAQNSLANPITSANVPALQYGANAGQIQTGLDTSGVPALPNSGDFAAAQKQAQDAAYNAAKGYLDPQYQNAQSDLDSKLANQGIVQGSDAYNRAQTELGNQRTQAYNQAMDSAIQTGNAEQNTLFGQGVAANQAGMSNAEAAGSFANSAQGQQYQQSYNNAALNNATAAQSLQQQENLATLPLNELNALRSGTQIQNPQFTTAPQASAANTDISGDIYKSYQLNQANNNNFMSGLFGLGGSVLGAAGNAGGFGALFSDRRLKRNIRRVGRTRVLKVPVYEYTYVGAPDIVVLGVMADEVAAAAPRAVRIHPSGYRMVDYAQVS